MGAKKIKSRLLSPARLMKRFRKYKGLLYCISSAFAVDWRCEPEEPFSLALVLFSQACYEFDPAKGVPFRKFVAFWVRRGLAYEQKRRVRQARKMTLLSDRDEEVESPYRRFELEEFLESLSEDGKAIVRVALNKGGLGPSKGGTRGVQGVNKGVDRLYKGGRRGRRPRPPVSREDLENEMARTKGWNRARTRQAIKEVGDNL